MTIVVSGYRRSGTSAMMGALYSGLTEGQVLYQPAQERLNKSQDGYVPNPGHLYEVGRAYYMNAKFLRMMPQDSLVKILFDGLPNLPAGKYVLIWMDRDEGEINQSVARSDAHLRASGVKENPQTQYTFDAFRPYNRDDMEHVLGIVRQRRDIDLVRVNFRDLVERPVDAFERIKHSPLGHVRVPIDVEKSADFIKPEYYRSKDAHDQSRRTEPPPEDAGDEQPAA